MLVPLEMIILWLVCTAAFGVWFGRRYRSVLIGIVSAIVFGLLLDFLLARLGLYSNPEDEGLRTIVRPDGSHSRLD